MQYFPDILKAAIFAAEKHRDQKRKYTGEPYVNHVINVAQIVESVHGSAEQIMAALLHDTIEDTGTTATEIRQHFGYTVARLVVELSDVSRPQDGNRATRKAIDRAHYGKASPEAKTVKLADMIDNGHDIKANDPGFAKVYLQELALLLPLLVEGDERLYKMAEALLI